MEIIWMDPKSIRFSEESIHYFFQRGPPIRKGAPDAGVGLKRGEESLQSLLEKLTSGATKVIDIPRIRVVNYKDWWYSLDNRRLWVLRQFGEQIPVDVVERPANTFLAKLAKREGADCEAVTIVKDPERRFQSHEFVFKQELLNYILKWSVRDLLSARPLQEMDHIPAQHMNWNSYMELLSQWLLEETRAQIQQALLKISDLACTVFDIDSEVRAVSKKNSLKRLSFTTDHGSFLALKRSEDWTSKLYNPVASDIVLLATFAPQNPGELYQANECCTLAVVQGGHSGFKNSFEAIVYAPSHGPVYKEVMEGDKTWYAVKVESIVTCQRIWDSLHQPEASPMAEYVATYSSGQHVESAIRHQEDGSWDAKMQTYCCNVRHLNESQAEAVRTFISRLLSKESGCGVQLIQGPPGTGKTSTLTAMLSSSACVNTRILVCAPTNTAVNEAADRFLVQWEEDLNNRQRLHFCSDFESPLLNSKDKDAVNCSTLRSGDIVMFGSEDRLAVEGSRLENIFLPLRVKRLLDALHPETGWEVLKKAFLMHLMEVSSPTLNDPIDWCTGRSVLQRNGERLVAYGTTLCMDLPSIHLSTERLNAITSVISTIEKLLKMLANESSDDILMFSPPPEPLREVIVIDDDDDDDDDNGSHVMSPKLQQGTGVKNPLTTQEISEFMMERQNLIELLSGRPEDPIFPTAAATSYEWLEAQCVENASLVFSTVSSVGLRIMKLGIPFSCVIVDEAAQLVEAETAIITQMKEVNQLILVGDQKQLPATVISQLAQKHGYGRSVFERLKMLGHPWLLLDVQYRMHPAISAFPNKQFYNLKLKDGDNVLKGDYSKLPVHQGVYGPYAFIDVSDGTEENVGSSKRNCLEAEIVVHLLGRVHDSVCAANEIARSIGTPLSVGVISPYGGQVGFIKDCIRKSEHGFNLDVEVKSIDGFQGREKDIIIFTAVRANQHGGIGFVSDERRLNVALTRGRYAVWILGSASTLSAHGRLWRDLIADAKTSQSFFEATKDEKMSKLIRNYCRYHKPILHQDGFKKVYRESDRNQGNEPRSAVLLVSPSWSDWDCQELSVNDGPDWSCVPSSPKRSLEVTLTFSEVHPEADRQQRKQSRSTRLDAEPTKHLQNRVDHYDGHVVDLGRRSHQRDRCRSPYAGHRSRSYTRLRGWESLPAYNANRFAGSFEHRGPFQVNREIHERFEGEQSCSNPGSDPHGWDHLIQPDPNIHGWDQLDNPGPNSHGWDQISQPDPNIRGWDLLDNPGPNSHGWDQISQPDPNIRGWDLLDNPGPNSHGWDQLSQRDPIIRGWDQLSQRDPIIRGWDQLDNPGPIRHGWDQASSSSQSERRPDWTCVDQRWGWGQTSSYS